MIRVFCFVLTIIPTMGFALELPLSIAMQRPMVSMAKQGDTAAWLQYDEFSPQLDILNFRSKTGTTSTIDKHTTLFIGAGVALTDDWRFSYTYSKSNQLATRQVEPLHLNSHFTGHEVRSQYTIWDSYPVMLTLGAGYRLHRSSKENIQSYFVGKSNAGKIQVGNSRYNYDIAYDGNIGNITTMNGTPLATFQTKDQGWLVNGKLLYEPIDSFNISLGAELRRITVQASFLVPAMNDPVIQNLAATNNRFQSFKQDIPQSTPWHETHILLQASLNWQPWESITFGADLTHYQIKRTGYIPSPKRPVQQNSAEQFDGYIFWQAMKHVTVYGHGRASTRYLLGDLPLAYNSRSNHRFNNPYGFLSAGGVISF